MHIKLFDQLKNTDRANEQTHFPHQMLKCGFSNILIEPSLVQSNKHSKHKYEINNVIKENQYVLIQFELQQAKCISSQKSRQAV